MNPLRRILFASIALVASLPAFGQVVSYCNMQQPTSVPGCFPVLSVPDLSLATGSWNVSPVPLGPTETTTNGIFIYTHGVGIGQNTNSIPTVFGTLCLNNPFKRTFPACAFLNYSGTANTCVGSFTLPINCNAGALGISVGDDVNVQCWYRDPPTPTTALFTHAVYYTVQ
jgi:hypothetical protein